MPARKRRETVMSIEPGAMIRATAPIVLPPAKAVRPRQTGEMIGVRMQPDLVKRLDKARGGFTRAQHIRTILDMRLPR